MIEFRPTQRKRVYEQRKDHSRDYVQQCLKKLQNQGDSSMHKTSDNTNSHLNSNYTQIKQLMRERKILLDRKAEKLIKDNRNKLDGIGTANDQDLKSQARSIGDMQVINLLENSQNLNGPRVLLHKISSVSNINNFDLMQRQTGKAFWVSHKQFEREMKRKAEIYANQSKQLKGVNQRERSIFMQIEKLQSQMISILIKARKDPDHIKKAQRFNQQVEKRKTTLKQTKSQKQKLKKIIQDSITSILQFNSKNQIYSKKRYKQLDQIFGGSSNLAEFDQFLHNLQIVIEKKGKDTRNQEISLNSLKKLINDYDLLYEQVQKFHEEEQNIFGRINQIYKQNTKFALLQKIYLAGISNKHDQIQLLKKCQSYRRLLADLDSDRPLLTQSLNKITQMGNMLHPVKKAYSTQDIRKQQLRRQLKQLCQQHKQIQTKLKNQRNFAFEMEKLIRHRQQIQNQLNDCAEKGNLVQYKKKAKFLQEIDLQIQKQRSEAKSTQIVKQQQQLCHKLQKLNENYEDIIEQIIVQDQKMYIGTYLNKLDKRLSLV